MRKAVLAICLILCALVLADCSQTESGGAPVSGPAESPTVATPEPSVTSGAEETPAASIPVHTDASISTETENTETEETNMVNLQIGAHSLKAELMENPSARAFAELLAQGPVTVQMHDYGRMEKVGSLPTSLPENNQQITTEPGDLILYQGNSITIYYDTNNWSLTRLGKVQDVTQQELREILGEGDVEVTFSAAD